MPLYYTDSYKLSHKGFMNEGTELIYSNLTPRSTRLMPKIPGIQEPEIVFFGLQYFIKDFLIKEFEEFFKKPKETIDEFHELIEDYLGVGSVPKEHFLELHELGYLPIEIRALPEGTITKEKIPVLTIHNTHPRFAWLTNYLESVMSSELWKPIVIASIIRNFRKMVNSFALETTGSLDGTEFQLHDFSSRGMSGRHDSAISGSAFLLNSKGTDTVSAMRLIRDYYGTNLKETFIGTSVPATEHMISCLGTSVQGELESYRKWLTVDYPSGIVSLVSDTYDYWKVLTEFLPELKEDILNRKENALGLAKTVIRPDSGDPADIICGLRSIPTKELTLKSCDEALNSLEVPSCVAPWDVYKKYMVQHKDKGAFVFRSEGKYAKCTYTGLDEYDMPILDSIELFAPKPEELGSIEVLWNTFGGTVNEQGYRVLHPRIGLIYGDSMTPERVHDILVRLKEKGYASTNVIFGVGAFSLQYVTRDTLGLAVKATYARVNGVPHNLEKSPKTDSGTKKSARGLLQVHKGDDGLILKEECSEMDAEGNLLEVVFKDGVLIREQTFQDILDVQGS